MMTKRYKLKPVENVIREIRAIKDIWPRPFIEFADDNSFVNRARSKKLLRALAGEGIKWFTETDVAVADDPELLDLMRQSGCAEVLIGFESPTAGSLDGVELNNNWKRRRLDDYREAIRRIQSHGIAVNGCFVLGMDGDTVDCFPAVRDFVADSGLCEVQITVMTPFPGTPLYASLAGGRQDVGRHRLGEMHVVRRQLPTQPDVGGGPGTRPHRIGEAAIHHRGQNRSQGRLSRSHARRSAALR